MEWCSDADLAAKVGDAGDVITPNADITLYAHWILNTSIDVSFTSPMNSGDDAYLTVTMTPKDISIEPNPITTVAQVNVDSKSYFVPIVNGVGTCIVRNLMEKREYVGFDAVSGMDICKYLPFDIQAVFDGDDQYKASTSDIKQLTVELIPTTLTVSVDKTTVNEGEPLTVTVELEPKIDACVTVKAMVPDDTEYRNNYNLWLDKGRGTKTFYGLPAGPRNINANFAGDDRYARSSCKNVRITVNKVETTVETVVSSPVIAK